MRVDAQEAERMKGELSRLRQEIEVAELEDAEVYSQQLGLHTQGTQALKSEPPTSQGGDLSILQHQSQLSPQLLDPRESVVAGNNPTFRSNQQVGAPTPNFLSMRGPNHTEKELRAAQQQHNRYDEVTNDGQTQITAADVTSMMGGEAQGPPHDTSMVQDQDLQKLIGQFRE